MSEFKDGEITFTIDFKLMKYQLVENVEGFNAKYNSTKSYMSNGMFHTKNEAIDAMIRQLEELKE